MLIENILKSGFQTKLNRPWKKRRKNVSFFSVYDLLAFASACYPTYWKLLIIIVYYKNFQTNFFSRLTVVFRISFRRIYKYAFRWRIQSTRKCICQYYQTLFCCCVAHFYRNSMKYTKLSKVCYRFINTVFMPFDRVVLHVITKDNIRFFSSSLILKRTAIKLLCFLRHWRFTLVM